ncbi:type III secretion system translocon protein [Shewanella violacea]|uniref:Secretion system effector, putative n=1 Tax=Shewanella violacea (strain JCM 10179 / CIP 106290 / LMG 19151 / DSS12) TaxID=637905 RepID=D4ZKM5_SHEVD|nr:type III secretion system translocon protein [Shewanella violacea]BAJ02224.1 secretion system effector, putative [Shewanella violacea DSS12]
MSLNSVSELGIAQLHGNYGTKRASDISKTKLPDWSGMASLYQTNQNGEHQLPVTVKQAEKALQRILVLFFDNKANDSNGNVGEKNILSSLENTPMNAMVLMATNLSISTFADTANAALKSQKIMSKTQEFLRNKEVDEFQEQLAKAVEQADKAQKGGIFGAVFDWIVGAAEAIYGAIKLVEGGLRCAMGDVVGGALDIADGTAYLGAGVAGMVKAAAETAILCGADRDKWQSVIDVASKVQLGCEVVAMALDMFQAGRAISAARGIAKGTEKAVQEGAGKLLETIASKSSEAMTEVAKDIGKQVSDSVANKVLENLGKSFEKVATEVAQKTEKTLRQRILSQLVDAFSKESIEKLVTKSVENVGKKAIKEGVKITAEDITKQVVKEVRSEVIKAAIKACTCTTLEIVRGTAEAGNDITQGSIAIEKAKLQKKIEELILKEDFLEFCHDWYDKAKAEQMKSIKDLINKEGDSLEGASKAISQNGSIQAQIAGSTV